MLIAPPTGTFAPPEVAARISAPPQPVAFRLPETYKIRGVDLSRFNGEVDFKALANAGLRFVYVKATEGQRRDPLFARNWTGSRQAGLAVGAYHEFELCGAAAAQFDAIREVVPKTGNALPVALAVEPDARARRSSCSVAFTRQAIGDLAHKLTEYYGKKPIIYGNASTLSQFVDGSLAEFPIWLAKFMSKVEAPKFVGSNPWTLWQVTDRARFAGVEGFLDLNLFFGNEIDFTAFSAGVGNIARNPALRMAIER